jgi:hypothetical protein
MKTTQDMTAGSCQCPIPEQIPALFWSISLVAGLVWVESWNDTINLIGPVGGKTV